MSEPAKQGTLSEQLLQRAVATRFDVQEIVIVPLLAVIVALIVGGIVMLVTGVAPQSVAHS